MDWQEPFKKAVLYFKRSKYGECLRLLNYALENGGKDQYAIYDSRAAVYEKTLRLREALIDVKEAIRLAPNRWQCYFRAARLFLLIRKYDEASKMVDLALQKVNPTDDKNRSTLVTLQSQVLESRKRLSCHVGMLPTELLSTIFGYLIEEDPAIVIMISRVCRHWRTVALGDASLWSTLVLSKKDPNRKSAWWIQRSKGRIRELYLRRTLVEKVDWSLDKLDGIQWDHLRSCHLEDIDIFQQLEKASGVHVISQLETLEIRDKLMGSRESFVAHLGDNLKHLILEGAMVWLGDLQTHSLVSLTVMRLGERFLDDIFQLLSQNPSIESLVVNSPFSAFKKSPEAPLNFAYLTTLEYNSGSTQLFKFIRLPSLEYLSVGHCFQTNHLIQCLLDSQTVRLRSIAFDSCAQVPVTDLLRLISLNPSITSLTLKRLSDIAGPVLDALASLDHCPALTHLDLSSNSDVTSSLLGKVLKSRQDSNDASSNDLDETASKPSFGEGILSLTVNSCPGVTADTLEWFRERVPQFSCIYMTKQTSSVRR
ncbi:hypothetical protein GYMLUDRAFT_98907 [Collybiopsis luxurians FD-317 M1]|uniref:F-box domain-containing protein n=1 Tax=Collybiopsis luxurians FD-317 M1 TaxID=944289 RepID=A0A0D0CPL5_9AGAR|nr:hypothetical protein GYMLUDRAFT_98907 [Collybiopsis luxurians FD-317 M1]